MEEMLCDYLALTPDPVVVARDDGTAEGPRIVHANPAFGAYFARPPEAARGGAFANLWEGETRRRLDRAIAEAAPSERTDLFIEGRCRRAPGEDPWVSVALTILPREADGSRRILASLRDISALKAREHTAAEALRERDAAQRAQSDVLMALNAAQERLVSAMNAYPDPFVLYDRNWILISCNAAYRRHMAGDPETIRPGMSFTEIMHCAFDAGKLPEPDVGREAFIAEMMASARAGDQVRDLHLGDDMHHRVIRTVTPSGDLVILRIDITELVRQRRSAQAAQKRLAAAMDAYPAPFVIYDPDLRLVTCNLAYRRHMSRDPDAIRPGIRYREVLDLAIDNGVIAEPAEGRDAFAARAAAMCRAGASATDVALPGDRHHRLLRTTAENGDFVILRMDVTELVRQRRSAQAARERLTAALDAYPDPFVIYDPDMNLVTCNTAYRRRVSPDPEAVRVGMGFREVVDIAVTNGVMAEPAGGRDAFVDDIVEALRHGPLVTEAELPNDLHNRILRNRTPNGDFVFLFMDITEPVCQRRNAEASQARLLSALDAYPAPFAIYDGDNRLVVYNTAYRESVSDDPELLRPGMELMEVQRLALRGGNVIEAVGREEEWLRDVMRQAEATQPQYDVALANGAHHRVLRSRAPNGDLILVRIDMTEVVNQQRILEENARSLEEANAEITRKAFHDELTGLGNRRFLADQFDGLRHRRAVEGGELTALHVDLDRFKAINDTIGHAAGDHVLRVVADRMLSLADRDDLVARIGGDEFIILYWERAETGRAFELGRALIEAMAAPVMFEGRECRLGASVGIARTPSSPPDDLLINSDIALYKAKRAGRGQISNFDLDDVVEMRDRKALADDIERGLENSEFEPFFQPQIDARTGALVGIEALARWRHPTRGTLAPDAFLAMAEELDVVARIDRMIFDKALSGCNEAFAGHGTYPSLALNVGSKRIEDDSFEDISSRIAAYPGEIAFELLETIFLEEESAGFHVRLDQLREMGIAIEVDDFGSGRASVVALQRIAPDRLKIDRRLVRPMTEGENAIRLVRSIIEIGNALDIGVTAEGVETEQHARLLAEMGVERLQGFFFARPMGLRDLKAYLDPMAAHPRFGAGARPRWAAASGRG
jgi:diguanylate cyclase (GGDEF)-like protein/PAS domain S-box-containing protein